MSTLSTVENVLLGILLSFTLFGVNYIDRLIICHHANTHLLASHIDKGEKSSTYHKDKGPWQLYERRQPWELMRKRRGHWRQQHREPVQCN